MTSSLTNIEKEDAGLGITDQFRTTITNFVNGLAQIGSDTANPFFGGAPIAGFYYGDNFGGIPPIESVAPNTTGPHAADLPQAEVVATTLVSAFQAAAQLLSRVRVYQLQKLYNSGVLTITDEWHSTGVPFGGTGIDHGPFNGIDYFHYVSTYQKGAFASLPGTLAAGSNVGAASLDAVVAAVSAEVTAWRDTLPVTLQEYWCHSSCHSNHSSRGRR